MPILNFQINNIGQAGSFPQFIYINTSDSLERVTTPGYLNALSSELSNLNMALIVTRNSPLIPEVTLCNISFSDGNWTATEYGTTGPMGPTGPTGATGMVGPTGATGSPGSMDLVNVETPTQLIAVNTSYVVNFPGIVTFTLPLLMQFGDFFQIIGNDGDGWIIVQNANQNMHVGNVTTTTGIGGSISSKATYDCIQFICTISNTDFVAISGYGNVDIT